MSPLDPLRLSRLKFGKADWLLSPGYNAPLFAFLPYVLTIHDLNHIDRSDNSSGLKRLYYLTVLRRLTRNARAVLTVSEYSRQRITDWFGLSADVVFNVGNGVSKAFVPDGSRYRHERPYFLCVSNRRKHKNEVGLLQAFAKANLANMPGLVLTGAATGELLALARELGIAERVAFVGRISEEELAALYRGALALVFPSFYEGFGLPIVEAFACGTPVITSNTTSMPEIAGASALLVDPHDIGDIAAALERIDASPEFCEQLARSGLQRAKNFTWAAVAERTKAAVLAVDVDPSRPLRWS